MCVDYSDLNKACPKDCYPLPNIDALVDAVAGYRYLCFMDAYSRYNQIPIHRPDEDKTAFIMPGGIYCYKVMPFALKNAGATYQRLMNKIFSELKGKTVEVYVDDILAKTTRPDDLLGDLGGVLRQYFQGHRVVVRTDQAIRQVLQKPDLAERMMTWAIELSQYDLQYEPRHAIKAQVMADFLIEVTGDPPEETGTRWRLHVDGASNQTSEGAGVILESPAGVIYEQSTKFEFPVSNNQAEYEALLGGLTLAREVGATRLEVCSDSQVVTSQVNGSYQARDPLLQKYLEKVRELTRQFQEVTVQHVPRERNTWADLLSKLASTKSGTGNRSLIQGMVKEPTVSLHLTESSPSWLDPIINFLEHGKLPDDEKATKTLRREATRYAIIQGQLFRKGLSKPLLKCLHPDQTDYFTDKKFTEFLTGLGIKQKFSSVEHPQTNGQVASANKVILLGLKKRLNSKKGAWADELASVLWSYRTTDQSSTGETPFRLTYGVDAVIPVEIGEPSPRLLFAGVDEVVEKDLVEETREMAHLSETALKQRIALRYNTKVLKRDFEERDLVLRRNDVGND
ncbi:uncharacterized protein [Arachis hypogaea]|uniref:uncharacterized protein n=1 Tax=Arachis hypogaea TaxID=3818 RepID=UPI003B2106F9